MWNAVDGLLAELMQGSEAQNIHHTLNNLQSTTDVNLEDRFVCDQLFYLLGLTSELLDNRQEVLDYYLQVWEKCRTVHMP